MIFVDGLGIARPNPETNPISEAICPQLMAAFRDHTIPVDATLGVPGLPQSATGQTSLLTGVNAQETIGRHVEGFPGPDLREIISEHSIFESLQMSGLASTFANGYLARTVEDVQAHRVKSVTTVATLAAFGDVRRAHLLEAREAVSHDLTREYLVPRGYTGEHLTVEEAAQDLMGIAQAHAFTLFEFFLTDRAGHAADMDIAARVLAKLDRLVAEVLRLAAYSQLLVVLTSDHGNIEDLSKRTHTTNPVPFMACGPGEEVLRERVNDLTDITPAILEHLR
jgi:2,3-bisphosphoglycerate-independent phosphoglycerate mutase